MNHTDLIKQLRDELANSEAALNEISEIAGLKFKNASPALVAADAYLAGGGWVRVEDALPVVPEGEHAVAIAVFDGADVIRTYWQAQKASFVGNYSHWRPDPLPNPPEQTK